MGLFILFIYTCVSSGRSCLWSISFQLSNLWTQLLIMFFFIFLIFMESVVMFPLSFLILVICVFFVFLLVSFTRGLSGCFFFLSFQRDCFCFDFSLLFSGFSFIDSVLIHYFFSPDYFGFNLLFFSYFIEWKLRLLLLDIFFFSTTKHSIL